MIVTVTPNPAWDLTLDVARMLPGSTIPIEASTRRAGGKGINVARVLAGQGIAVTAIAPVGEADAAAFAADLAGVPHRLTRSETSLRCTYAVVESGSGKTTMLTDRGSSRASRDDDDLVTAVQAAAAGAACVVISGSLPPGTSPETTMRLIAAAHAQGAEVIADLAGAHMLAAASAGAEVLKPNRDELRDAVGTDDPLLGARALHERGAGCVVVSLGEDGVLVVPRDPDAVVWQALLASPLVGNPTGAGDAAVAAIASLLVAGERDPRAWALRAVAWSAAAVLASLAGDLDPAHELLADQVILSPL